MTSLGMPVVAPPTTDPPWKQAWDAALYGAQGFYRRESPAAHFRTSTHVSPLFAGALAELAARSGLDTVVDVGAGGGELLSALHDIDPSLDLLGVEVASRPPGLDPAIAWTAALPTEVVGVVVANEWLDNVPCHVVQVDPGGVPRVVHVDPVTGIESWGSPLRDPVVPRSLAAWLERWWPLEGRDPGARAEVGSSRDAAWADVVSRLTRGVAVAIDYGHVRAGRPFDGSLRSYRDGRSVDVRPDGSRDVTAHVALDAVADRVGGVCRRQRDVLHELGVDAALPHVGSARQDPQGYLGDLARSGQAAELTDPDGLGDFGWVLTTRD